MKSRRCGSVLCLATLSMFAGCMLNLSERIKGSGVIVTESRAVAGFSIISLESLGRVTVRQTGKESLTIRAEDNLLPLLDSWVGDRILHLSMEGQVKMAPTKPIEIAIEVKNLDGLRLSGIGSIDAKAVQGKQLSVSISGVGDVTVAGNADSLKLHISHVGTFHGEQFQTRQATVRNSGVGSAIVNVTDQLDATVSGVGSVQYVGSPHVRESARGVGRVKKYISALAPQAAPSAPQQARPAMSPPSTNAMNHGNNRSLQPVATRTDAKTRPAWINAPPQVVDGDYQTSITVGPYTTRGECDAKLPEALQESLDHYVETCLDEDVTGHIRLPSDYLRQQLVKAEWEETRQYSVGPMTQLHVLLRFDRKVKDRILEAHRQAVVEGRLWLTGSVVLAGLGLLAVLYGYLKMGQRVSRDCPREALPPLHADGEADTMNEGRAVSSTDQDHGEGPMTPEATETHSILVGYILWIFGFLGSHRFYYGKPITGTIWFFTLGLLGIGWLVDLFLIPGMARRASFRYQPGPLDYTVAWVLLTFLGILGVHRLYLGKWITGIVYFLTGGLLGFGLLYDLWTLNGQVSEMNRRAVLG